MSFLSQIATPTVPVPLQEPSAGSQVQQRTPVQRSRVQKPRTAAQEFAKLKKPSKKLRKATALVNQSFAVFAANNDAKRRAKLTPEQREAEDAQRKADAEASRIRTSEKHTLPAGSMQVVMQSSYHDGLCNSVSPGSA